MGKKFIVVFITLVIFPQINPLSANEIPSGRLVTTPTCGLLPGKTYCVSTHLFEGGGVVEMFEVGLTDLINVGISYGGSRIIGSSPIVWQPHVGFQARVRIVEETMQTPAVTVGFNSQGEGSYIPSQDINRFRFKSRGAYIVFSRNYRLLGDMGLHGGVNYSLETDDGDSDPSFWAGVSKSVGLNIELCGEYDFATNDNEHKSMTADRGYFNVALKWNLGKAFTLEVDLKNILRNDQKDLSGFVEKKPEPTREIRLSYTGKL